MSQPIDARGEYVLGYGDAEHGRLARQALLLAPITQRLFRNAGIGPNKRVLDIGSGIGDVALIAARLVGPSGEVVGIERDAGSIERARERAARERLEHVTFVEADASALPALSPFDAVVGRFVLNHNPNPAALLRSLRRAVRPGGTVAFQEVSLSPALAVAVRLPLWEAVLRAIDETVRRSDMSPDIGLELPGIFQGAGLPTPHLHLDMPFAHDATVIELQIDLLRSLRPAAERHAVSLAALGDFDTLVDRIQAAASSTYSPIPCAGVVSAWSITQ